MMLRAKGVLAIFGLLAGIAVLAYLQDAPLTDEEQFSWNGCGATEKYREKEKEPLRAQRTTDRYRIRQPPGQPV